MNNPSHALVEQKNTWLRSIVDVEYPTPQSLEGRKLYLDFMQSAKIESFPSSELLSHQTPSDTELFLVDFHRLTVMFSILRSRLWQVPKEQELIVEFLSQIILTPEHELYVAFTSGEPVGCALVSQDQDNSMTLISDVTASPSIDTVSMQAVVAQKLNHDQKLLETVVTEVY